MLTKPYPKDNEPRTMALPADLVGGLDHQPMLLGKGGEDGVALLGREGSGLLLDDFRGARCVSRG